MLASLLVLDGTNSSTTENYLSMYISNSDYGNFRADAQNWMDGGYRDTKRMDGTKRRSLISLSLLSLSLILTWFVSCAILFIQISQQKKKEVNLILLTANEGR